MSAKTLIDEIREKHYTNVVKKKSDENTNETEQEILYEQNEDEPRAVEVPKKRKRRTKAEIAAAMKIAAETAKESTREVSTVKKQRRSRKQQCVVTPLDVTPNTFSITIVGGIGLPGYPLNLGEKLAIVKLTPIAIGK